MITPRTVNNEKGQEMVQKDKLIQRLKSRPSDFTFDEAETLLTGLGYHLCNKGHTSGSRLIFRSSVHGNIILHKPHPGKILKHYQLTEHLEKEKPI